MSYAAVVAENSQPASQQPRPNPALLNTTPPTHSNVADDTLKVNIVGPDFKEHPRTTTSEAFKIDDYAKDYQVNSPHIRERSKDREESEQVQNVWEVTKYYLFRPGVAGGLIGIVNIGIFASIGRTFYDRPDLRQNAAAISSAVATSVALLSLEGYIAEAYRKTPRGQEEERRARKEGALIYRHLHEQIIRPQVLGGLVGIVNAVILGGVGYFAYANWRKPWDRRVVSAISVGLFTLWGGEGILAEKLVSR